LISVQSAAAAVVRAVVEEGESRNGEEGGAVRYVYEAGEIVYPLSAMAEMKEFAADVFEVKTLPLEEWVEKAEELGFNPLLGAYLKRETTTGHGRVRWAFPKLVSSRTKV
jgi:hybrid polyketide synthase/nonribosomal peptide synthetase ACE1